MTEKFIKKLLEDLNKGIPNNNVIMRPLTEEVIFSRVITGEPAKDKADNGLPCLYLVKEVAREIVGAVVAETDNLRWYILPSRWREVTLGEALRNVILPHLLQHKPIQRLVLNKAELGETRFSFNTKVAVHAGFRLDSEEDNVCKYTMNATLVKNIPYIEGKNTPVSGERQKEICGLFEQAAFNIEIILMELEMKRGMSGYTEDLRDLIRELSKRKEQLSSVLH